MKLQEIQDQGFTLCAWVIKTIRGERRVVIKLGKKNGALPESIYGPLPESIYGHAPEEIL